MATPKEPVLRARVDENLKARFDAICQQFGETPSDRMRQLVEDYVRQHADVIGLVEVRIERPAGYDWGAWRVTVALRSPEQGMCFGAPIAFALPELPSRLIRPDPEYGAAVLPDKGGPIIGGRFVEGLWRADLYSNGVPEDANPTSIADVKTKLKRAIETTLQRYHGTQAAAR